LQKEHSERYAGRFAAFRTFMELVEEFKKWIWVGNIRNSRFEIHTNLEFQISNLKFQINLSHGTKKSIRTGT
jgi:hypothetical protein